jgi:uncharacterized coiled-coil protein SlyX
LSTQQKQSALLTSLESGVSQAHQAIDNLEKSQAVQVADITKLQNDMRTERARVDDKERELSEFGQQLKVKTTKLALLEKTPNRVDALEKRVAEAEKDGNVLAGVMNEQKGMISALNDLVHALKGRLDVLEAASSSRGFASPAKIPSRSVTI